MQGYFTVNVGRKFRHSRRVSSEHGLRFMQVSLYIFRVLDQHQESGALFEIGSRATTSHSDCSFYTVSFLSDSKSVLGRR